jgi:ATP-dependent Lon protease
MAATVERPSNINEFGVSGHQAHPSRLPGKAGGNAFADACTAAKAKSAESKSATESPSTSAAIKGCNTTPKSRDIAVGKLLIANTCQVYSEAAVEYALNQAKENASELEAVSGNGTTRALAKMLKRGGTRFLTKPASCDALAPLYEQCPNFTEVLDGLRRQLELSFYGNESFQFMPLLLAGDPGVGKTHFALELAKALGTAGHVLGMSSMTAGWVIAGSSSQWKDARMGKLAQALVEGDYGNPLFILDELDKGHGDPRYDVYGGLYQLFEAETAQAFKDEFLEVEMDMRHVLWVATANEVSCMPAPILDRMTVYDVPMPNETQGKTIAGNIYKGLLAEHATWKFAAELHGEALARMGAIAPRMMKKALLDAFGYARLDRREELKPADFDKVLKSGKRRIGF